MGDFTGDGIPDLAVANLSSNTVSVLLGRGDGSFQAARNLAIATGYPTRIVAGDFTGDGIQDLAVAGGNFLAPGTVSVLLSNGDGTFQPEQDFAAEVDPRSLTAADVDGDGRLDLVEGNPAGIKVLLGNGDGTFQTTPVSYQIGTGTGNDVVVVDANGDGLPDVVMSDSAARGVTILLNDGNWPAPPGRGPTPAQPTRPPRPHAGQASQLPLLPRWASHFHVASVMPLPPQSPVVIPASPDDGLFMEHQALNTAFTPETVGARKIALPQVRHPPVRWVNAAMDFLGWRDGDIPECR